ncbi:hypothetical protein VNO77_41908 [Canavalia gladiata]|uniref:Uncharacterized protein n=1 Tax=Canavalia gladiata TaxID=3824 RepID=A0AAN9K1I5_CANGL
MREGECAWSVGTVVGDAIIWRSERFKAIVMLCESEVYSLERCWVLWKRQWTREEEEVLGLSFLVEENNIFFCMNWCKSVRMDRAYNICIHSSGLDVVESGKGKRLEVRFNASNKAKFSLTFGKCWPYGSSRHIAEDCPIQLKSVKSIARIHCSSGVSLQKLNRRSSYTFADEVPYRNVFTALLAKDIIALAYFTEVNWIIENALGTRPLPILTFIANTVPSPPIRSSLQQTLLADELFLEARLPQEASTLGSLWRNLPKLIGSLANIKIQSLLYCSDPLFSLRHPLPKSLISYTLHVKFHALSYTNSELISRLPRFEKAVMQRFSSVHLRSQLLNVSERSMVPQCSRDHELLLNLYAASLDLCLYEINFHLVSCDSKSRNARANPGTATAKDWRVLPKKILPKDPLE